MARDKRLSMRDRVRGQIGVAAVIVGLQTVAALYFIADAIAEHSDGSFALPDVLVGLALLGGIVLGGYTFRRLLADARRQEAALAVARGAMGELVSRRFEEWNLSRSESEVALFALKGCTISEIARLRGSAEGTVRSQLSQVYAKAGVTGQPMLMSLFLDDLIDEGAMAG